MKKFTNAFFTLISLGILLVSCAHQTEKYVLTEEDKIKINEEALALASQRLETLVAESKKQGHSSVQYLSTSLFLKGNSALMEGDYVTGSVLFRHLISLTDDPFVHKKFAVALIRLGEMEEAQDVLQKLYQRDDGKDESVALILAGIYASLDKVSDSQSMYRKILAKNPKQEDACLFLGKSLALEKKWKEAEGQLKVCQREHPKNGIYGYYLGKMHVDRGDLKSAVSAFEDSHRRDPAASQSAAALGLVYEQWEQIDKAIAVYKKHLALRPNDESILNRLVQALFIKERFAEVIPYAERLVDLEPEDLNMKVKLGILYTDAKEYDKAISVFKELLQYVPDSDKILYYLGAIHQELEKFETAIDYFAKIPTSSGLYQDSSFQMASMLSSLALQEFYQGGKEGKLGDKFLNVVESKIQNIPELKVELSVLKAGYFESVEKDSEAIQSLAKVSSEKEFNLQHQYYLAGLYEKVRDFKSSTSIIMTILDKDPKNAHAWNFIGYSMLERGQSPAEALPYIEKALAISPDDGYIRDSLGWYYFKTGRQKEALKELTHAFKKVPDDMVIAKHLALIHKEMKNYNQAKEFLKQALKNARLNSEKKEIVSVLESLDSERSPASILLENND
ncbi:MAG: tetratricopeptide repeat protein [Bacteriovoracaceae bacterium]|nr:tetratricopeptide repeat protein [Bacteriovoracaceae bacterium]